MDRLNKKQNEALKTVCAAVLQTTEDKVEVEEDYENEKVIVSYTPTNTKYKCNCAMDSARAIMLDVIKQLHAMSQ